MQTFLPYPDFDQSAKCIDPSRLGNQAYREGKTLIKGGWPNHPACKMWKGYEVALAEYCLACLRELASRNRHYPEHIAYFTQIRASGELILPPWLGDERLHSSHRSALLFKKPEWYAKFGWGEKPMVLDERGKLPYFWPSKHYK
jgi:hypothetical protein